MGHFFKAHMFISEWQIKDELVISVLIEESESNARKEPL